MHVQDLHRWDVSPTHAKEIQTELRDRVRLVDTIAPADIRAVAGVDNGYAGRGRPTTAYAAVVVLNFPDLEVIETQIVSQPVTFPYVPGLLSFREAPAMLAAFRQVETVPDVVLVDGQGYAHPRRLGSASHLGLFLDIPTIGCAKSRLIGAFEEPGPEFGSRSELRHDDETIGTVVRTRPGHKPLFVSPGHQMTVETAVEIALACCRVGRFMPEPTRLADRLVSEERKARAERS